RYGRPSPHPAQPGDASPLPIRAARAHLPAHRHPSRARVASARPPRRPEHPARTQRVATVRGALGSDRARDTGRQARPDTCVPSVLGSGDRRSSARPGPACGSSGGKRDGDCSALSASGLRRRLLPASSAGGRRSDARRRAGLRRGPLLTGASVALRRRSRANRDLRADGTQRLTSRYSGRDRYPLSAAYRPADMTVPGTQRIRVALIGAGLMGSLHGRVVSQSPDAELSCIIDPNEGAGMPVAERFRTRWLPKLDDLGPFDAVIVASPTETHAEWGQQAIAAGKPVLVEKPLSEDADETHQLIDEARRRGVPLMCGLLERFNPAVMTAMTIVDEPIHITSVRHSPYADRIATGVAYDLL